MVAAAPVAQITTGHAVSLIHLLACAAFAPNLGNSMWGASFELVKFIKQRQCFTGSVVELGAGCGAVGLVMWSRGAKVTLTDLEHTVPFMQMNIDRNAQPIASPGHAKLPQISALPLDWTVTADAQAVRAANGGEPFDLVIGAEVSYDDELYAALIDTLLILLKPSDSQTSWTTRNSNSVGKEWPRRSVLLAIPLRNEDGALIELAKSRGFQASVVATFPPTEDHSSTIAIYALTMKV